MTWRVDTIPLVLSLPQSFTMEATGPGGAAATYSTSASDGAGSGLASSSHLPVSGSTFAVGMTTVNATATDHAGNTTSGTLTVTVQDTAAPVVAAHANVSVPATSAAGAVVNYAAATASDAVTTSPAITYSHNNFTRGRRSAQPLPQSR